MSLSHKFLGQMRNNPPGSAIKSRGNAFHEGSNLGDFHGILRAPAAVRFVRGGFRTDRDRRRRSVHCARVSLPSSIAGLKPRRRRNVPHFFATAPQSGRRPFLRAANVEFSAVAGFYHGLPLDLFPPTYEPRGGYLAFLGRISREKRAIEMASALGMPLKIAAKVDKADDAYFREAIVPLLARPGIEFLGEIGERDKAIFLGEARALLFPIDWPEPFGLVMIESMACATPVLAFRCGSAPEIVDQRVTGCLVGSLDEAIRVMPELLRIDRRGVALRSDYRRNEWQMIISTSTAA